MKIEENTAKRQRVRDAVDRISELPGFILHIILSNLDTQEACRASVLSKTLCGAWFSIPVLDFQPQYFMDSHNYDAESYDDDAIRRYVGFIDKTMGRYFMQKYRITKLHLELPMVDKKLKPVVDKWMWVAVLNQIQELHIEILLEDTQEYMLPQILFCARSLKVLKCVNVELPYYETMDLISLECLTLVQAIVDDNMLQRIISLCPLVELDITKGGLEKISLPWMTKVNEGAECFASGTMQSNLKASPLRKFVYHGTCDDMLWPLNINVGALKNLRKLEIVSVSIRDDIVSELACGLVALESLLLSECNTLECITISSISLKEFRINECWKLMKATIDAPNLVTLFYNCELDTSLSLIRVQDHCNAHFFPSVLCANNVWFVLLKKFLTETNFFKSLVMDLSYCHHIVVEADQLRDDVTGPPYKLRELKLINTSNWGFTESCHTAFLDGLFWCWRPDVLLITASFPDRIAQDQLSMIPDEVSCGVQELKLSLSGPIRLKSDHKALIPLLDGLFWSCRPDILSLSIALQFDNTTVKILLEILEMKVKCWKHPLKHFEIEGPNCYSISYSLSDMYFLYYFTLLSPHPLYFTLIIT